MLTVVGWDGGACEVSCRHECLEHEDFSTRSSIMGRTLEEELVGVMMTGGPRAGEARAMAEQLAQQRMTTIDRLVRQELERQSSRADEIGQNAALTLDELDRSLDATRAADGHHPDGIMSAFR